MNNLEWAPHASSSKRPRRASHDAGLFALTAAIAMAVVVFVGFSRFYLHGRAYPDRELTPPIRWLLITHGAVMSAWMLLLTTQAALVRLRRYRLHMALGRLGIGLAAAVFVVGCVTAVRSAQVAPPEFRLWNFDAKQFMAVSLAAIVFFGVLTALALVYRRRPHLHRAFMLTGTLLVLGAAFDRIDPIRRTFVDTAWGDWFGPYFPALVLGVVFLALRGALARRLDVPLAIGVLAAAAMSAAAMAIAPTPTWDAFASVWVH